MSQYKGMQSKCHETKNDLIIESNKGSVKYVNLIINSFITTAYHKIKVYE